MSLRNKALEEQNVALKMRLDKLEILVQSKLQNASRGVSRGRGH